jgi:hypothetical protein
VGKAPLIEGCAAPGVLGGLCLSALVSPPGVSPLWSGPRGVVALPLSRPHRYMGERCLGSYRPYRICR